MTDWLALIQQYFSAPTWLTLTIFKSTIVFQVSYSLWEYLRQCKYNEFSKTLAKKLSTFVICFSIHKTFGARQNQWLTLPTFSHSRSCDASGGSPSRMEEEEGEYLARETWETGKALLSTSPLLLVKKMVKNKNKSAFAETLVRF